MGQEEYLVRYPQAVVPEFIVQVRRGRDLLCVHRCRHSP